MLVVYISLSSSYRYLMKEDSMCDEHVLEAEVLAVPDNGKEKRKQKRKKTEVENVENVKTKCNIAGPD